MNRGNGEFGAPKPAKSERGHDFALGVEKAGQEAVAAAIAEHKSAGNPIYYRDPFNGGPLIKEYADGRRFAVTFSPDGAETELEELLPG